MIFVNSRFFNVSSLSTQGIDYKINYDIELTNDIRAVLSAGVNQVLSYDAEVPGFGDISFAGGFIDKRSNNLSPGAVPRWRGLADLFVYAYNFSAGVTVQYVGEYQDDPNFTFGGLPRTVSDYTQVNLVLSYAFRDFGDELLDGLSVTVGIDNLFDVSPPFAAGAFADGYDTSTYSIQNRFVYGSISLEF